MAEEQYHGSHVDRQRSRKLRARPLSIRSWVIIPFMLCTESVLLGQERYGALLAVDKEPMLPTNATHVLASSMADRTSRPVDSALSCAVRRSHSRSCSAEPSAAARRFFSATNASFSSVSCYAETGLLRATEDPT